jgi:hypothetical protein
MVCLDQLCDFTGYSAKMARGLRGLVGTEIVTEVCKGDVRSHSGVRSASDLSCNLKRWGLTRQRAKQGAALIHARGLPPRGLAPILEQDIHKGTTMTDFKDRERGEEAKFAFDEENAFKIAARRNRLMGEWAAGLMGLTQEEADAYKKAVVQADFEEAGDEDVIRKLLGDLTGAECDVSESDIRAKLNELTVEARRQLLSGT